MQDTNCETCSISNLTDWTEIEQRNIDPTDLVFNKTMHIKPKHKIRHLLQNPSSFDWRT
jgi:hypothetical protein